MPSTHPITLLILKLTLAPGLIGIASLVMTRLGPHVGGLVSSLPVVAGPILLFFALEQGTTFASEAAKSTLMGTAGLLAYAVCYARLAKWRPARRWIGLWLLLGYSAFFTAAKLVDGVRWPPPLHLLFAIGSVLLARTALPNHLQAAPREPIAPLGLGLLLARMLAAAILVYSLSEAAVWLGPGWSGVLAAFPVVGTVVLVATHWDYGFTVALAWLRGFVVGLFGYLAFLACIAYTIAGVGIAMSFGAGVLGAALTQMSLRRILQMQGRPSSG